MNIVQIGPYNFLVESAAVAAGLRDTLAIAPRLQRSPGKTPEQDLYVEATGALRDIPMTVGRVESHQIVGATAKAAPANGVAVLAEPRASRARTQKLLAAAAGDHHRARAAAFA